MYSFGMLLMFQDNSSNVCQEIFPKGAKPA